MIEKHNVHQMHSNEFAAIYWAVIKSKGTMNEKWKKRNQDPYDGWYDCRYESRYLSIDCIRGSFLVDGMTIGFLPEKITSDELFVRVFDHHIFEVQMAKSPQTYITKHLYHGNGRVQYEFYFNDQVKRLIITERHVQTDEMFQLIPHSCFCTDLPDIFVSRRSHWMNMTKRIVQFRSMSFKQCDFLDNVFYILSLETGYITNTDECNSEILVNQSSIFFQNLFDCYFERLDEKPYVYMMRDLISQPDIIVHIHLSRLGIAFKYNATTNIITSREYSDMCVHKDQWLGTLTGLTFGLLLSPLSVHNSRLDHYPYKKLIVPFGTVLSERNKRTNHHQTVTIDRSVVESFYHKYFVFILNDRLKILQSTDSPTGWLYLALLHAMTSHPLPDQYTGMTGMERAFQLLNSAGCWSDEPFDEVSLNILVQIASISPKASYYPEHLTCMEKLDWNANGLTYSMQHFGYYLIAKNLIDASQKFNFMYRPSNSDTTPELFKGNKYNVMLLKNLYWSYRDSYNPIARLPIEMEADIQCVGTNIRYQHTSEHCGHVTNYSAVRLVDNLYYNGDVDLQDCSKQHWLPLSQWLTEKNSLKNIWIGLLKLVNRLKIEAAGNITDDIKRFEGLLDFLHYISGKCGTKPFYLQMLKTALKMPTISLTSVTFPPFIVYRNIEEISCVKERIVLRRKLTACKRQEIQDKISECFSRGDNFRDDNALLTSEQIIGINNLLKSWQSNKQLRSFLDIVQSTFAFNHSPIDCSKLI